MKKIFSIFIIIILSIINANNTKQLCTNNEDYINNSLNTNLEITNGTDVLDGKYPWYGTVKREDSLDTDTGNGGGVLIAPDWFLTAAHVADNFSFAKIKMKIVFGMYDKNIITHIEKRLSKEIIVLGGNNYKMTQDIALVKLDKPITDIKPIKIVNKNQIPKPGNLATIMGFGITGIDKQGKAIWPNNMQEADIPIQSSKIAKDPKYDLKDFDEKYDLIAGNITGKRVNASLGDSGGPLVKKINNQWTIVGIVSNGKYDWVTPLPIVYTSVGVFHYWISSYVPIYKEFNNYWN